MATKKVGGDGNKNPTRNDVMKEALQRAGLAVEKPSTDEASPVFTAAVAPQPEVTPVAAPTPPVPQAQPVVQPAAANNKVNVNSTKEIPMTTVRSYTLDEAESSHRTLGLASTAVNVNDLKRRIAELLKSDPTSSQDAYGVPSLHIVEAAATGLPCNALLLIQHADIDGKRVPFFFTLLMETTDALPRRPYSNGSYPLEVLTVTGDIYNDEVRTVIAKQVTDLAGGVEASDAGFRTVPATLDISKEENLKYVRALAFFGFAALNTCIDVAIGQPAFLDLPKSGQQTLAATIQYNGQEQWETGVGESIRSDVVISTSRFKKALGIAGMAGVAQPATALAGYMDLFYAPAGYDPNPVAQTQPYNAYGTNQPDKAMWFPRFVITRTQPMGRVISLGEMLLTLATATLMGQNYNWTTPFMPKRAVEFDRHDIGALGYEHEFQPGVRDRINTQDESFNLFEFLTHTVHNRLFYSWDIEESGDLSWIEGIFLKAAEGDVTAQDTIWEAGQVLTGNRLGKGFDRNTQKMFADEIVRIQLGSFPDGDRRRDSREFDHLAWLNIFGKKDPTVAEKWSNALVDYPTNNAQSLVDREALLNEVGVKTTRYAQRITPNPEFLLALANAIKGAGTTITYDAANAQHQAVPRVALQYVQFGQSPEASTGLFQQNYHGQQRAGGARPVASPVSHNPFRR